MSLKTYKLSPSIASQQIDKKEVLYLKRFNSQLSSFSTLDVQKKFELNIDKKLQQKVQKFNDDQNQFRKFSYQVNQKQQNQNQMTKYQNFDRQINSDKKNSYQKFDIYSNGQLPQIQQISGQKFFSKIQNNEQKRSLSNLINENRYIQNFNYQNNLANAKFNYQTKSSQLQSKNHLKDEKNQTSYQYPFKQQINPQKNIQENNEQQKIISTFELTSVQKLKQNSVYLFQNLQSQYRNYQQEQNIKQQSDDTQNLQQNNQNENQQQDNSNRDYEKFQLFLQKLQQNKQIEQNQKDLKINSQKLLKKESQQKIEQHNLEQQTSQQLEVKNDDKNIKQNLSIFQLQEKQKEGLISQEDIINQLLNTDDLFNIDQGLIHSKNLSQFQLNQNKHEDLLSLHINRQKSAQQQQYESQIIDVLTCWLETSNLMMKEGEKISKQYELKIIKEQDNDNFSFQSDYSDQNESQIKI